MKSVETIVPKELIKQYYQHPQDYGDFIVELINGMYTDVYIKEDGGLITITNEVELIKFIRQYNNN